MKLFAGLLDRLLFAAGLIVFLQIPQYLDHYVQRYSGYRQALGDSVGEYQLSANQHYGGDLGMMIHEFKNDEKAALRDLGRKMETERAKLERMDRGLAILQSGDVVDRLLFLAGDFDMDLARATLDDYRPGLPLALDALICGLIGGVLVSGLFNLLLWLGRQLTAALRPRPVSVGPA